MKTGFLHSKRTASYVQLHADAKRMRQNPTESESLLWQLLSGNKLGVKFRRQHVIGDCIADFACISKALVVELDGGYHAVLAQQQADASRTAYLQQRGFTVIRFTNDQVLHNIDSVIETIKQHL